MSSRLDWAALLASPAQQGSAVKRLQKWPFGTPTQQQQQAQRDDATPPAPHQPRASSQQPQPQHSGAHSTCPLLPILLVRVAPPPAPGAEQLQL
jgi:hypothetical protein